MAELPANSQAKRLKAWHIPKSPVVFTNIWDVASCTTLLALDSEQNRSVRAFATASWAIAAANDTTDGELTFEQSLAVIKAISPLCQRAGVAWSCDLQDGYGNHIEDVARSAVRAGASGVNIEDNILARGFGRGIDESLYPLREQEHRLKCALKEATDEGCPDFLLNARCDVFCLEDDSGTLTDKVRLREAVDRGKAFLELGATTVFYWGGPRQGLSREMLQTLVHELNGRVAVLLSAVPGGPTLSELADIGVARISTGPTLYIYRIYIAAMGAFRKAAMAIMSEGRLSATYCMEGRALRI